MLQSSSKRARKKIQRTTSNVRGGNKGGGARAFALQGKSAGLGQLWKHPTAAQSSKGGR